jgi:AcrR family transcriptional regulator
MFMNDVRSLTPPTEQRRASQREALTVAAERMIAEGGLAALKARELARAIGVALGALYNLVPDLDALAFRVASRTLTRMETAVLAAAPTAGSDPAARLIAFAHAYRRFAADNTRLWRALFEHRGAPGSSAPEGLIDDQMRLFGHVSAALAPLVPEAGEDDLFMLTRTLFGAVHGVVLLGLEEKLAAVPPGAVDRQLTLLVSAFCAGLAANRTSP